jgi:hypothetical protein
MAEILQKKLKKIVKIVETLKRYYITSTADTLHVNVPAKVLGNLVSNRAVFLHIRFYV